MLRNKNVAKAYNNAMVPKHYHEDNGCEYNRSSEFAKQLIEQVIAVLNNEANNHTYGYAIRDTIKVIEEHFGA